MTGKRTVTEAAARSIGEALDQKGYGSSHKFCEDAATLAAELYRAGATVSKAVDAAIDTIENSDYSDEPTVEYDKLIVTQAVDASIRKALDQAGFANTEPDGYGDLVVGASDYYEAGFTVDEAVARVIADYTDPSAWSASAPMHPIRRWYRRYFHWRQWFTNLTTPCWYCGRRHLSGHE